MSQNRMRKPRPGVLLDKRTRLGRRVAQFEQGVVAATLKANGKSKGQQRPLSAEQGAKIRLACCYEALCARLENDLLAGSVKEGRTLSEALDKRDAVVRSLTR